MGTPTAAGTAARDRTITVEQRRRFDEQGYLIVSRAVPPELLDEVRKAVDEIYESERRAGRLGEWSSLHLLGFVRRHRVFLELLDLETTFPLVWGLLGWNIYVYHSHLDVHPPVPPGAASGWGWHQDGGRQNLELETVPRPRLSVKVAFWLSDLSEPGRGNTLVIPGSHLDNTLDRPDDIPDGSVRPPGAVELLAAPGDAVVFDRRLWHSRSPNRSAITRRALFFAYTYRWVRDRDDPGPCAGLREPHSLTPIRRQLLGAGANPHSFWGLGDQPVPLYDNLRSRGLLDPRRPSHR